MIKLKKIFRQILCLGIVAGAVGACADKKPVQIIDNITVVDDLVINENSVPIFPKKAALTTDTARRFAIDLPKRCTVDWNNQNVVTVVPEEKIEVVRLEVGDELPDLQVSDYNFKQQTVKSSSAL